MTEEALGDLSRAVVVPSRETNLGQSADASRATPLESSTFAIGLCLAECSDMKPNRTLVSHILGLVLISGVGASACSDQGDEASAAASSEAREPEGTNGAP